MNKIDEIFKVTQAYSDKENPSAPIRSDRSTRISFIRIKKIRVLLSGVIGALGFPLSEYACVTLNNA